MNNDIEFRHADHGDIDAIQSLTRQAYAKWVPVIGREPLPMSADYNEAMRKHRIDLLFYRGKLAALIEVILHDNYLLIENVAVLPSHQGQGLGRKLLDHAEQLATTMDYSEIKLYTNKLFTDNLLFYEKLGYQLEKEEEFMGGVCVHMNKVI